MSPHKKRPKDDLHKIDKFIDPPDLLQQLPLAAELSTIDPAIIAAVKERIDNYHERFPQGEPMFKRKGPWRMFIETRDIMLIKRISLRSAQRLLQNTRFLLEKKPDADITVTAFCSVNDWDEKEIRAFLDKLDEEDE